MVLLIPLFAAALTVVGIVGAQMMRTTGLEDVEASMRSAHGDVRQVRGLVPLLDLLGKRLVGTAMRTYGSARLGRLDETIRRAGRPDGITVTVYVRRQMGFLVLSGILVVIFAVLGQTSVGFLLGAVLCSWMRVWLVTTGRRRQAQIETELPDFLDVLGVTVAAGLAFRQAVERVCEFHEGPLAQEMTTALREMSVGVSRRQAFLGLRDRTRSEAVGTFVTAMLQAEELGVPLSDALTGIAADVRQEYGQRVRQQAAKAAPKVSLVITTTIVPGALLLMVAAVLLANMDSFRDIF
ncbi:type II secretion system protein F [Cellulomonas sp. WB94]|uniref:type II secretion system F family protein n=1 Tax=Cellulomonas sp. WB94 TaxID=2173174 RepID=UPI000D57E50D|nr:type II secretion system F family protein [Cellulomonas sp. WB94]PVU82341.1 type II secretion system protein F [Cellulomonas sp. WB94]